MQSDFEVFLNFQYFNVAWWALYRAQEQKPVNNVDLKWVVVPLFYFLTSADSYRKQTSALIATEHITLYTWQF
jgi:hypothetical protein